MILMGAELFVFFPDCLTELRNKTIFLCKQTKCFFFFTISIELLLHLSHVRSEMKKKKVIENAMNAFIMHFQR